MYFYYLFFDWYCFKIDLILGAMICCDVPVTQRRVLSDVIMSTDERVQDVFNSADSFRVSFVIFYFKMGGGAT